MNWLGNIIQRHVSDNDTVVDLGCGIMQATTDILEQMSENQNTKYRIKKKLFKSSNLKCKLILGCDLWEDYLKVANRYWPVIKLGMNELNKLVDNSFDIVLCLDVLEHLELQEALYAIEHMKRIARRKVIIYTPSKYITNEEHVDNAWGLGENPYQIHKCFLEPETLTNLGFDISFPEPDKNTLGIFNKSSTT
ncbi:MAG: class I SAM-dependent methyltransferase [Thaumarchaeota archaeon]|nr:class I SAM-dependent methyltransferase [Nitrososphaerota archaeon]